MNDSRYLAKEFISEFLKKYRELPCIWKIKSKEYTNKTLKNKAYDELVDLCKTIYPDANRDFVVKKIQSFRGSFRKELKKVENSKKSCRSADEVYVPTLWYYHLLEFTLDQEIPTESTSNIKNEEHFDENPDEENWNTESAGVDDDVYAQSIESTSSTFFQPNSHLSVNTKRKIFDSQDDFSNICTQAPVKDDVTEYDAIGINVASKLQRMNPTQSIYAELLINKVLTHGLLGTLTSESDILEKTVFRNMPNNRSQTPSSFYSNYSNNYHVSRDSNTPSPSNCANNIDQDTKNNEPIITYKKTETPESASDDNIILYSV